MNPHSVVSLDRQLVSVQVGRERITEVLHTTKRFRLEIACSQYHLAVAGGCGACCCRLIFGFAPTRYREVVLTAPKDEPQKQPLGFRSQPLRAYFDFRLSTLDFMNREAFGRRH